MRKQRLKPLLALLSAVLMLSGGLFLAARAADDDSGGAESEPESNLVFTTYTEKAMLMVYLDGQLSDTFSGYCAAGQVQTLTAPEITGKVFSHWAVNDADGPIASTQNPYQLAVYVNTTLYAVYTTRQPERDASHIAFTALAAQDRFGYDALRITATYSLPDGSDAAEVGIVYTSNRLLRITNPERNVLDALDVNTILQSGDEAKTHSVHSASDDSSGTASDDSSVSGTVSSVSGAAGDWTLFLTPPVDGGFVYAAAYVKVGGGTIWSDPVSVRYAELDRGTFSQPDFDYNFTPTQEDLAKISSDGSKGSGG